ncbi:MAG: hypothetical protein GY774_14500 [Planctomycetes bacterium]|nr:hypothetical protein [Planctomycetota bacterium]
MQKTEPIKAEIGPKELKTAQGLLLSALDMEDEIAHSVYRDYMERENWPPEMKDEVFEEIHKYLTTLLKETERHRTIIIQLQSKLGQNDE